MKRLVLLLMLVLSVVVVAACAPTASAVSRLSPNDYVSQYQSNSTPHLLVDVRTPQEYADGHIAGSVNLPLDQLNGLMSQIPTDIPVVVYCRSGNRSAQAATILANAGYTQIYDMGGIIDWVNAGYPVE